MLTTSLTEGDRELIATIAEYRMLSITQMACLLRRSRRAVRRPVIKLEDAGLAQSAAGFGRGPGRPEKILSVTDRGTQALIDASILPRGTPHDRVTAARIQCVEYQLLDNWLRIQLLQIEHQVAPLTTRFLSPHSPFLPRGTDDRPLVHDQAPAGGDDEQMIGFVPDGVFTIAHVGQQKTILFFLEVDMGTETIAGRRSDQRDIRQKVVTYQQYFRSLRYKRYEQIFSASLRGFRLLFLTNTYPRLAALCQFVQSMPPSDFVWLTDQERMLAHGVGSAVWARGGHLDAPLESILGGEATAPMRSHLCS